jgi:multiple sugar transport system ATP-binding protein
MAVIELEQVAKQYPTGVWGVRDLSWTAREGELLVLVGPSGCGKTTTLRLIAGLEEPTHGVIRMRIAGRGQPVNGLEPWRRNVAMVSQRPTLYPHLTVRRNLAFGLKLRSDGLDARAIQERVCQAADLLGLADVLDRRPAELSGGQQQRVALGRAIVRRPLAFLLDEPLSSLDAPRRIEMRRELHLLQRRLPATMIYVTHDQAEAMALGDRVVVMNRGTVQQVDRPGDLYERPCNRFVAGFLGWPPMSFLDGRLEFREGRPGFGDGESWVPAPIRKIAEWTRHAGRGLTLGIRPEDVGARKSALPTLAMTVELVEVLGREYLVTLARSSWRLTSLWREGLPPGEHDTALVSLNMERAYLFDRVTGVTLSQADITAVGAG